MASRTRKKKKTNRLHKDIVARRKQVMRACVNLFVLAGVLVACGMGIAKLRDPETLPLNSVQMRGEFRNVSESELRDAVDPEMLAGFFTTDVEAVRERVKALPWVDEVAVRRVWPDRLAVTVIEQDAVANWGNDALLNSRGEIFKPNKESFPVGLPKLVGPKGNALFVLQRYVEMNETLASIGRDIDILRLDERRAWRVKLDNGLQLSLGRNERNERLQRFNQVYTRLFADKVNKIKRIDLRYTNGLAVHWKKQNTSTANAGGEKDDHVKNS